MVIAQRVKELENMSDGEESADTRHSCEDEQQLEKEIDKELHELKYFLDKTDELIKLKDYKEMDTPKRRAEKSVGKLSNFSSQVEGLKIDHGVSPRSVRQWKKDVKARYSTFLVDKEKLAKFLNNRQEEIDDPRKWKENDCKLNKNNSKKKNAV